MGITSCQADSSDTQQQQQHKVTGFPNAKNGSDIYQKSLVCGPWSTNFTGHPRRYCQRKHHRHTGRTVGGDTRYGTTHPWTDIQSLINPQKTRILKTYIFQKLSMLRIKHNHLIAIARDCAVRESGFKNRSRGRWYLTSPGQEPPRAPSNPCTYIPRTAEPTYIPVRVAVL